MATATKTLKTDRTSWKNGGYSYVKNRNKFANRTFAGNYKFSNDSLGLYLKQINRIPVLTREEEVDHFRQIEKGIQLIFQAFSQTNFIVDEIINTGKSLKNGEMSINSVIDLAEYKQEEIANNIDLKTLSFTLSHIKKIEETFRTAKLLEQKRANAKLSKSQRKEIDYQLRQKNALLPAIISEIGFKAQYLNQLSQRFEQIANQERSIEEYFSQLEKESGVSLTELIRILKAFRLRTFQNKWFGPLGIEKEQAYQVEKKIAQYLLERKNIISLFQDSLPNIHHIINKYIEGNQLASSARNILIESNLRLVVSIARRYSQIYGFRMLDLIQEGNLGLMHAIQKFDYRLGNKLSTYATWWIRQAISRGIKDRSRLIRIPVHRIESLVKFNRVYGQLTQDLQREPSVEEIAQTMDVTIDYARMLIEVVREPISLDSPAGNEEELATVGQFVVNENSPDPVSIYSHEELSEKIRTALSTLTQREENIIRLRFGIGNHHERTLSEIGNNLGVTRERIRQIEVQALNKLRKKGLLNGFVGAAK